LDVSDLIEPQRPNFRIQAFIFDMDGVVVDTTWYHYLSWKYAAKTINFDFQARDNEQLKGVSRHQAVEIILELAHQTKSPEEKIALCELKNKWFLNYVDTMSDDDLVPGVLPFLSQARKIGLKIGLGSGSRNARYIISKMQLTSNFDVIVDGNEIKSGKPDPEVFIKVASLLQQTPSKCLVFEDAEAGVKAARAAGMQVVGVGNSDILNQADLVIPGFLNLDFNRFINAVCV